LPDLARDLALPVLLVVGMRLGCLNHALLTARAIRADGLELAGWIANAVDPDFLRPEANLATLAGELQAPLLGQLPYAPKMHAQEVATLLKSAAVAPA
jgi:dethiobiotin synthetase